MAELARGSVTDRPWGRTFAALGLRGVTGQLTVTSDGKRFPVAFARGAVVAALSPIASDAAVRVAMTGGLISSTQVADIVRRQQAAPDRDEIELIAEWARLGPDQALRLRRRVVAQRAARTFSIERGEFIVEDQIALDVVPGSELDVRAVVYLGARYNVSEQRLASEVAQFGTWFKIVQDAVIDLPQFGFADEERLVIELLLDGAGMEELELSAPGVDMRMVRAVVYSLVACGACEIKGVPAAAPPPPQPVARGIPQAAPRAVLTGQATSRATPPPMQATRQPPRGKPGSDPELTLEPVAQPPRGKPASSPEITLQARGKPTSAPDISLQARRQATSSPEITLPDPRSSQHSSSAEITLPEARSRQRTPSDPLELTLEDPRTAPRRAPSEPPRRQTGQFPAPAPRQTGQFQPPAPQQPTPQFQAPQRPATPAAPDPRQRQAPSVPGQPPFDPRAAQRQATPVDGRTSQRPSGQFQALDPRSAPSSAPPPARPGRDEIQTLKLAPIPNAPTVARPRKPPGDPKKAIAEVELLITARARLVDDKVDHYTMLGVTQTASADEIRKAYFAIARQLHPDRLSSLGIADEEKKAQRLFAHVNLAFGILSSPPRRAEYTAVLKRGGEAAIRAEDAKAEQMANRILEAEEAFRRGELAMRNDQIAQAITEFKRAIELNPEEADYFALLAWAQFCNAPDKATGAVTVRRVLATAIRKSPNSVTPRFYLGRVERMLGRDQEALHHFQEVLDVEPGHAEATAEVRYLKAHLDANQRSKR